MERILFGILMSDRPLVSILVVTRNNKDAILRNLQSVFSQSYSNIEVVIIDSSSDDSPSIIKECIERCNSRRFGVRYIHTHPRGVGAARNLAIRECSGEYIVFLDSDCYVGEDYVERAMQIFLNDSKILAINVNIKHDSVEKGIFARAIQFYDQTRLRALGLSSRTDHLVFLTCRKKAFDLLGLFVENLEAGEDLEWIARSKKSLRQLEAEGYKAVTADLVMFEEKRAWSFGKYWRKCLWYGGAFADPDYLKASITTPMELAVMFVQVCYPISLFLFWLDYIEYSLLVLHTLGFLTPTLYILLRAQTQGNISRVIVLMPFLVMYKSFFLLLGAAMKAGKNLRSLNSRSVKLDLDNKDESFQ